MKLWIVHSLIYVHIFYSTYLISCKKRWDRRTHQQVLNNTLSPEKMDLIKKSWFSLLEENSKLDNTKKFFQNEGKKQKKKIRPKKGKFKEYKIVDTTPPGRPPMKPGMSVEDLKPDKVMSEFRSLLQATATRRASQSNQEQINSFLAAGLPDVSSAFMIQLESSIVVPKKTFTFLRNFQVGRPGTFIRGQGIDMVNGRFTAQFTAIYRFQATLHISRSMKSQQNFKPSNSLTARICIDNDCDSNVSLYFRSGLSSNSKTFSINVSGHLYLQKNQFVELIIENTSITRVTVLPGSIFTGYLIGV